MEHGDVVGNELTVQFSSGNVIVRVSDDLLDLEDHIVLLLCAGVGIPLTTQHLRIVPRHLRDLGTGATLLTASAAASANVGTATVRNDISLPRLAEVRAVGARDEDGGAGGSGQQGDPTVVEGSLSYRPQRAQPGVAVAGVLQWWDK